MTGRDNTNVDDTGALVHTSVCPECQRPLVQVPTGPGRLRQRHPECQVQHRAAYRQADAAARRARYAELVDAGAAPQMAAWGCQSERAAGATRVVLTQPAGDD